MLSGIVAEDNVSADMSAFRINKNDDGETVTVTGIALAGDDKANYVLSDAAVTTTYPFENIATVTVAQPTNGTITGLGYYIKNTAVTVTATPNSGYTFVGWYTMREVVAEESEPAPASESAEVPTEPETPAEPEAPAEPMYEEVLLSNNAEYTFTVTEDIELIAKFSVRHTGGGGGGSSVTTIKPTVSDGAEVKATVSGSTATISKLDTSKMEEGKKDVSIDMSDSKKKVDEVKIKTDDVKSVDSLEIKLSAGTVSLDTETLDSITTEAKGSQIAVELSEKPESKLNSAQKKALEDVSTAKVLEVVASSNNKTIDNLGNAKVTVPFELKEGELADTAKVWRVDEDGTLTKVDAVYNKENNTLEFEADQSADYVLSVENEKDAIILTIGETEVQVFGESTMNDVAPKIVNDRTMLPIRMVAEALGAMVDWLGEEQTVTIKTDDIDIALVIGESYAVVNGERYELDTPSFIENERTYLSVRFVAEALGSIVDWNAEGRQVIITK